MKDNTIDIELQFNNNSISFIKLLAAFQVLIVHAIAHLELGRQELVSLITTLYPGVPLFFIASGFLNWLSLKHSSNKWEYYIKRFYRIYPELWMAVAIEIISIIILYHGYEIKSLIAFAFTQGTIFQFWTPDSLRGYGCGTPNGTLWTICVTIQFYIIGWFIFKQLHNKRYEIWVAVFVVLLLISIGIETLFQKTGVTVLTKLYHQSILRHCWLFYIGCFLAEYGNRIIPLLMKYWYCLYFGGVFFKVMQIDINAGYHVISALFLVSGLIGFAYRYPQLSLKTDISYGVFLYHMIFVNIFITFDWTKNWSYVIAVLLLTIISAYISNYLIGDWAARRKNVILNKYNLL